MRCEASFTIDVPIPSVKNPEDHIRQMIERKIGVCLPLAQEIRVQTSAEVRQTQKTDPEPTAVEEEAPKPKRKVFKRK